MSLAIVTTEVAAIGFRRKKQYPVMAQATAPSIRSRLLPFVEAVVTSLVRFRLRCSRIPAQDGGWPPCRNFPADDCALQFLHRPAAMLIQPCRISTAGYPSSSKAVHGVACEVVADGGSPGIDARGRGRGMPRRSRRHDYRRAAQCRDRKRRAEISDHAHCPVSPRSRALASARPDGLG